VTPEVFPSETALAAALARRIIGAIKRSPGIVLGLPTGRTPLALYEELVHIGRADAVDWSEVRTFNLDEFVGCGSDDEGSYRRFMNERFFSRVGICKEHIGFLDGLAPDLAAECSRYERAIVRVGGIDLMILGIGANGHIGFNEPADHLIDRTHVARLDEETRAGNALWFGGDVRRVPREALTMGMATILAARTIVLIAAGEAKAAAVKAMTDGGITTRVPASFLRLHSQVSVLLDQPLVDAVATLR
jgi:glucosamine-6-phosphate deaminase